VPPKPEGYDFGCDPFWFEPDKCWYAYDIRDGKPRQLKWIVPTNLDLAPGWYLWNSCHHPAESGLLRVSAENQALRALVAEMAEALGVYQEWWDTEAEGPKYSSPLKRQGPNGEHEWREWWDNQIACAQAAPVLAKPALAKAAEVLK
jgi:hypothetical protein